LVYFLYLEQLNIENLRKSSNSYKKDRATRGAHAAQALVLRERLRCASDSTNIQSSIINSQSSSGLSGLGYDL
jgi:hypothetical protein